ncbi:MAG TPA: hypothetical protein VLD67_02910 [Vicinamibacterales bacterium]|nr:hypothetical protein [Vicinamibacterales bacterium]
MRSILPVVAAALLLLLPTETLRSVAALPAHVAGKFEEISACREGPEGQYYIFDRRAHAVFSLPPSRDAVKEVIRIGGEAGRILRPTAFDVADDGTFVVADAPGSRGRVQVFFPTGDPIGGFGLPGRETPVVVLDGLVLSGLASLAYTGRSVLISQPFSGALVVEYALDGKIVRSIGQLRRTGHEGDPDVHLALNAGLIVSETAGGFYYIFVAGVPVFRRYDAAGTLLFERHIEGIELDDYVRSIPTAWPRRRTGDGAELPLVRPAVRAAAADRNGNLWISLGVPYTYVYDSNGDKRRTVQFRAAGIVAPNGLSFTSSGRILVTPGCYTFPTSNSQLPTPD